MRVPSASELDGGTFWVEAQVSLAGRSVTLPASGGHQVWQADQWPATRISGLELPRFDDDDTDVFRAGLVGSDGHRLRLTCFAENAGQAWRWSLGEYIITKVKQGRAALTVEAADLSELVIRHEGRVPEAVHASARPVEVIAGLLAADDVAFWFEPGLPLPRIRAGYSLGTDRGAALQELAQMWGVHLLPHPTGGLGAYAMPGGAIRAPEVRFSDLPSEGGQTPIIGAEITLERSQIHNHIIVPVRDSERVAEAYQTTGRYAVTRFGWQSLRLDSSPVGHFAEAQGLAKIQLQSSLLRTVTVPVEAMPDWRVRPFSAVEIETDEDGVRWGRVTGIEHPLTPDRTAVYDIGLEL